MPGVGERGSASAGDWGNQYHDNVRQRTVMAKLKLNFGEKASLLNYKFYDFVFEGV